MPNPKTVALEGILNEQACFCSLESARAIADPCDLCRARAELAALRSRPSEKSVEECVKVFTRTQGGLSVAVAAVRAFLLDEEAGRVEEEK